MSKRFIVSASLIILLAFLIPFEHKHDKLFRFYSLTLIPQGLKVDASYNQMLYFYVSDILCFALLPISLFWHRTSLRKFFGNPLWIVLICAIGSILVSPFVHYPIPYSRLLQLLTPILLFSFLTTAFQKQELDQVTVWVMRAVIGAASIQAIIGIAQYFHQGPLGLRFLSESREAFSVFRADGGSIWLFDPPTSDKFLLRIRAQGTFPHANIFGGFMALSLLFSYAMIEKFSSKKWLLVLPIQLFALFLSYSRSAIFAWLIATSLWFFMMWMKKETKNLRLIAAVLTFSTAITLSLIGRQLSSRGGITNYNRSAQFSDFGRKVLHQAGYEIVKDHPLLGVGFSQFTLRSENYFPPHLPSFIKESAPHNIFLYIASETGLISLFALLFTIASIFWRFLFLPLNIERITFASLAIAFIFIGFCDFYPLLHQQGKLIFFLIFALFASHLRNNHQYDTIVP
jgi:O-antigen ligase